MDVGYSFFLSTLLIVVIIVLKKDKDKRSMNFRVLPEELCVQTFILCIIKQLLSTSPCLCLLTHTHCKPIRSCIFMSLTATASSHMSITVTLRLPRVAVNLLSGQNHFNLLPEFMPFTMTVVQKYPLLITGVSSRCN